MKSLKDVQSEEPRIVERTRQQQQQQQQQHSSESSSSSRSSCCSGSDEDDLVAPSALDDIGPVSLAAEEAAKAASAVKSANVPYIKEEEEILSNINLVKAMKEKFLLNGR